MPDLHYATIAELAPQIKDGSLSPVELTTALLERIDRLNPRLRAVLTPMHDQAMEAARTAEAGVREGRYRGPLHGIPIGLKDLIHVDGTPTTAGSEVLRNHLADHDATVTRKLKDAGAVIIGKLAMHEFAYGPTGINEHYGTPANPWRAGHIPGGSSSGSGVAVAAGLCCGALGTDTGGSIRIPSALCGIVGLKPTYGRVSRSGVLALAWSLDHVGPMTRCVEDAALMLNVLAGHDAKDPGSSLEDVPDFSVGLKDGIHGLRVGVARDDFFVNVDPQVVRATEAAVEMLRRQGAEVVEVPAPLVRKAVIITSVIMSAEAATYHTVLLRNHWSEYGAQVRARLLPGFGVPAEAYLNAQRARHAVTAELRAVLNQVDVLVYPSEPVVAPLVEATTVTVGSHTEPVAAAMTRLNRAGNMSGFPAATVPCGFVDGLPVGLQILGRPWEESTVLRVAYAYEQATAWHTRRPPLEERSA